ncbi:MULTISPECIES: hypothetical protein [unclassified Arthrobacter]|uniref:hypothetical protein n=1 Tax=unclassified Arthrobacter TaxID=235627 RepID=UPI00159D7D8A|nr:MULTISPECIES: hypothetical protein [unclassified Arthrobacter]MCQ9165878.1 hypothetical protein [Arthrobacter sp. STN4]NVN00543.1 hypothetical protein [Arthrobacter sp. SDTb3-6]
MKKATLGWVGLLRNTVIEAVAEDRSPLQMSLCAEWNLVEITHPAFPEGAVQNQTKKQ